MPSVHDERILERISELADVAGPGVGEQSTASVCGDHDHAPARARRIGGLQVGQEAPGQERNVLRPLAERRDTQRHHAQPVHQIGAKLTARQAWSEAVARNVNVPTLVVPLDGCCWPSKFRSTDNIVRLPNVDLVVVEDAKVRDYLLSPTHPVGRFKSVFFVALGFSPERWEALRDALLELARTGEAVPGQVSPFGLKFEIRATFQGPSGRQAKVLTG